MTYEEILELAAGDDGLIDLDHLEKTTIDDDGLTILGESGPVNFSCDLRIVLEANGMHMRLFCRDAAGTEAEHSIWPDWCFLGVYDNYDDLHQTAFTL